MKKLSTLIILISLTSFNCDNSIDTKQNTQSVIYPLQVGNYWHWKLEHYDESNNIVSSDTVITTIVRDTVIDNQKWFSYADLKMFLYSNYSDGYYMMALNKDTHTLPGLRYKYPVAVNYRYQGVTGAFQGGVNWIPDTLYKTIVTYVDTTVVIPLGSFRCYSYKFVDVNNKFYFVDYLSPNIGLIKNEFYSINSDSTTTLSYKRVLIAYYIK